MVKRRREETGKETKYQREQKEKKSGTDGEEAATNVHTPYRNISRNSIPRLTQHGGETALGGRWVARCGSGRVAEVWAEATRLGCAAVVVLFLLPLLLSD